VLSLTSEGDWVFDPFAGVGTTIAAAVLNNRRGAGAEIFPKYLVIARERIEKAFHGTLPVRPRNRPVFAPENAGKALTSAPWLRCAAPVGLKQMDLLASANGSRK